VAKTYDQYCPIAHALDLVGERWSLLVVRELLEQGPLRYSDLHSRLKGCGTNILAARLRDLERGGVIRKRRLPPPAASSVYELTSYGQELRPVLHLLAHWGARSLGPPTPGEDLRPGWLAGALRIAFAPAPTGRSVEFRVGDERASLVDGEVVCDAVDAPDAVVTTDASGFYRLVVNRDLAAASVTGSTSAVLDVLAALPEQLTSAGEAVAPPASR
jgi:DNA-binding HxlR family transcriptional regulator